MKRTRLWIGVALIVLSGLAITRSTGAPHRPRVAPSADLLVGSGSIGDVQRYDFQVELADLIAEVEQTEDSDPTVAESKSTLPLEVKFVLPDGAEPRSRAVHSRSTAIQDAAQSLLYDEPMRNASTSADSSCVELNLPHGTLSLLPGTYLLAFHLPGYFEELRFVTVSRGQRQRAIAVRFIDASPIEIVLPAREAAAEVFCGGVTHGQLKHETADDWLIPRTLGPYVAYGQFEDRVYAQSVVAGRKEHLVSRPASRVRVVPDRGVPPSGQLWAAAYLVESGEPMPIPAIAKRLSKDTGMETLVLPVGLEFELVVRSVSAIHLRKRLCPSEAATTLSYPSQPHLLTISVRAGGDPVPDASVKVWHGSSSRAMIGELLGHHPGGTKLLFARTDSEGRCRVGFPEEPRELVYVAASESAPAVMRVVALAPQQQGLDVALPERSVPLIGLASLTDAGKLLLPVSALGAQSLVIPEASGLFRFPVVPGRACEINLLSVVEGRERGFRYSVLVPDTSTVMEVPLYRFPFTGPPAAWGRFLFDDRPIPLEGIALLRNLRTNEASRVEVRAGRFHTGSKSAGVYRFELVVGDRMFTTRQFLLSPRVPFVVMDLPLTESEG